MPLSGVPFASHKIEVLKRQGYGCFLVLQIISDGLPLDLTSAAII